MAQIKIVGFSDNTLKNLNGKNRYMVDINFVPEITYQQYVKAGFDPEAWEERNSNKVLINGKSYKDEIKTH